jgi:ketosteroid isomerase-like protein
LIIDLAKAATELPRNRDAQTILKFYAREHTDISDAEAGTFESMQKEITGVIEQMNLGAPIGISAQASNIKIELAGEMAWATYDSQMKIGANGKLLEEINQKCTTIFKKYGAEWLIHHEHCSSPKASEN